MPAIDYEAVNAKMIALIASKASHGRTALLEAHARFTGECLIPEDQRGFDDRPPVHLHGQKKQTNGAASHA